MLEVEDVLAFLRIVTNEGDDRALLRVCRVLQCSLDPVSQSVSHSLSSSNPRSIAHHVNPLLSYSAD